MKLRELKTGEYCLIANGEYSLIANNKKQSQVFQVGAVRSLNVRIVHLVGNAPSWWKYPSIRTIPCHADCEVIKVKIKKETNNVSN